MTTDPFMRDPGRIPVETSAEPSDSLPASASGPMRKAAVVWIAAGAAVIVGAIVTMAVLASQATIAREVEPHDLKVGDCVERTGVDLEGNLAEILTMKVVSCGGPHYGEVIFTGELPASMELSDPKLDSSVTNACVLNAPDIWASEDFYLQVFYPETIVDEADRRFECIVVSEGEPLVGTIADGSLG